MKKLFLILALTALMSIGASAEENNDIQQQGESSTTSVTATPQSNLADSFMAAFGMEVDAGGSGDAGPGMDAGSSGGTMAVGMSVISTTSTNQVTPPFTPYSYQK